MAERIVRKLATGVWQHGDRIRIRWGQNYEEVLPATYSPYNARHIEAAKKLREVRKEESKTGQHGSDFYTMRFEVAVERYLHAKRFTDTIAKTTRMLRNIWLPHLEGRVLGSIHQAEIYEIIGDWEKPDGSPYGDSEQKNRVSALRGVFQAHSIWPNPAADIKIAKTNKLPVDKYEPPERRTFLSAAPRYSFVRPGDFHLMAVIGFACGLRTGEILGLSTDCLIEGGEDLYVYRQVKGDGIDNTKTNGVRYVYIPTWARPHIATYCRDLEYGEFLFVNTEGNPIKDRPPLYAIHKQIHKDTNIVLHRQGFQPRDIYCFRHTRASELISQNNNNAECAKELGHGVGVFQRTYAHFIRGYSGKKDRSHLEGVAVPNNGLRVVS